jgi:hypothetical protein
MPENVLQVDPERYVPHPDVNRIDAPAANTAAELTFAAEAGRRHVVYKIGWSYDDTPVGGQIQVFSGGEAMTAPFYITSGGPGWLPFTVVGKIGQNLLVQVTAGGAAVTGSIWVQHHWTESN